MSTFVDISTERVKDLSHFIDCKKELYSVVRMAVFVKNELSGTSVKIRSGTLTLWRTVVWILHVDKLHNGLCLQQSSSLWWTCPLYKGF